MGLHRKDEIQTRAAGVVHVETIDLTGRGITLPGDRVGMVIAQPYLSLTIAEPYRCTPEARVQILEGVANTLGPLYRRFVPVIAPFRERVDPLRLGSSAGNCGR